MSEISNLERNQRLLILADRLSAAKLQVTSLQMEIDILIRECPHTEMRNKITEAGNTYRECRTCKQWWWA